MESRGHGHAPEHTRAITNRLARVEGHVRAIRRMVLEDRACPDILIQLAATTAALHKVARLVLENHVETCLRGAAENGTFAEEWAELKAALDRLVV